MKVILIIISILLKEGVPTKDRFAQALSIKEILDDLESLQMIITELYQYQKIKILELQLKREPYSYIFNNYFGVGLKAWSCNQFSMSMRQ